MNKDKVAVLVDTGCDVPKELADKYNIYSIPLKIIYPDKTYSDGVDITATEIYDRMPKEIPSTSLPSGEDLLDCLEKIKASGYEKVLIVTISSGLSGTYNMIKLVTKDFEGLEIEVVDTKNISIGSGFCAIQAAEDLNRGLGWEELKKIVYERLKTTKVFFCVETLEYLQKGGRIGRVTATLGTMLNLKPIISCNEEGIYYTVAKVRGRKKSIQEVIHLASEFGSKFKRINLALLHGGAAEEVKAIRDQVVELFQNRGQLIEGQISPSLVVHTGPGLIGIGVQVLEK